MCLGYLGHQNKSRKNYISQVRVPLENNCWHSDATVVADALTRSVQTGRIS